MSPPWECSRGTSHCGAAPSRAPASLILHVDMDAFFASVEQLDQPELRGKAVIVGKSDRGVVCACSYAARAHGVHSAMPVVQARKLCPHGVFLPVRMARYSEISRQVMAVLEDFSPLVEQVSVDEAYLDVTGLERVFGPPEQLGAALKQAVFTETGLTCSVGIAPVKFLAKIASDQNKPDGLFILGPEQVGEFLASLPVDKIPGVGRQAVEKLRLLGVRRAGDVLRCPERVWQKRFGKWGELLYARAQGRDSRPVVPVAQAKSEGAENTFAEDTSDRKELERWLLDQAERVGRRLRQNRLRGRTVTLKIKFNDFRVITRGKTLSEPTHSTRRIFNAAAGLLAAEKLSKPLRLIGLSVSNLASGCRQLSMFQEPREQLDTTLDTTLDAIREKFGADALIRGRLFGFHNARRQ